MLKLEAIRGRLKNATDYAPAPWTADRNTVITKSTDAEDFHTLICHDSLPSIRLWKAFMGVIQAYKEILDDELCHPALREFNGKGATAND